MAAVPTRKSSAVEGHVPAQASERVERRGVRAREDVARAEEEQRLEERVVHGVEQGARDAAEGGKLVARGLAQRRDAEADEDHADVLDRRVGQQPFHVVLCGGEHHAPEPRDDACAQQDEPGRAEFGQVAQGGRDAEDAVDARLDHHARHQGRDVRRCGGVGLRKPYVHREESGLHAEACQEKEVERQHGLRAECGGQSPERGVARRDIETDEADEQQHEADVHHDQVGEGGAANLAALGVEEDQQERRHGHQLPEEEERVASVGEHDAQHGIAHGDQRGVVQRDVGRGLVLQVAGQVALRVEHGGHRTDRNDEDEERREAVHRARVAAERRAGDDPQRSVVGSGERCRGPYADGERADERQAECGPRFHAQGYGEQQGCHRRQREKCTEKKHAVMIGVFISNRLRPTSSPRPRGLRFRSSGAAARA